MKEVKNPKKPLIFYYGVILLVVILLNLIAGPMLMQHQVKDVDYGTFLSMIADKNIGEVEIDNSEIIFTDKSNETTYKTGKMDDPQLVQRLYDSGAKFEQEIQQTTSPILSFLLTFVLPLIIFVGLGQYMGKKLMDQAGGKNSMMFGMGKSNAKIYVQSTEGIHFDDVAGEDEAKENLQEIVDYLHNPNKYTAIGASMPKGILLVGPPGTGKTMLAKAVAGESGVPFFSMSGSEFVEMFVGMGASKVRDLFKQAKEKAPCIVFIDEIDAIGKKRDGQIGGNDEREQTLNQLLTEMDGFEGNNGVIILAATNRPESLDPVQSWQTSSTKRRSALSATIVLLSRKRIWRKASKLSLPVIRRKTPCCPITKSRLLPIMKSAMPWLLRCRRTPHRYKKLPLFRAPPAPWATPCRWSKTTNI